MEKTVLKASERKDFTKSGTRKNRKEGNIPGVFYSKNNKPVHINVADKAINPLVFTSKTHLISLVLEDVDEEAVAQLAAAHTFRKLAAYVTNTV